MMQPRRSHARRRAPGFMNPLGPMKNLSYMRLRRNYNGQDNDLRSYFLSKALLDRPQAKVDGAYPATAVVLPPGSPGELIDPMVLIERFYAALPAREMYLAGQFTIYSPDAVSLWDEFDRAYQFARTEIADRFNVPCILIQHAPFRAGVPTPPHVHILALMLKLGPLGYTAPQRMLSVNCAQAVLKRHWERFGQSL